MVIRVAVYPRYRSVQNASQKFEIYFQTYNTTIQNWWSLDSQNNAILISRKQKKQSYNARKYQDHTESSR